MVGVTRFPGSLVLLPTFGTWIMEHFAEMDNSFRRKRWGLVFPPTCYLLSFGISQDNESYEVKVTNLFEQGCR